MLLVSKSLQANLVITTTEAYSSDFLLAKSDIWMHLMPGYTAQKDVTWHKIVAHGIPTSIFNCPEGMGLVKDEIRTFNKGLTPLGQPYWITSAENRSRQVAGSVAIAFATPEEASSAIRNRLYIAGISVRCEKHYTTQPTA